ncbi:helix-turn-helix domain-containing protein [Crenothrix sp.]|uniref:helix-turn-helix domain-containing protein n=1 Tax=Crenothrix sp. TaxID=3100433 RepID=UPI00374D78B4
MQQIAAIIKANDWTQASAATHCGLTQPRVNDLLRGRLSRFSLDALVNIVFLSAQNFQLCHSFLSYY